MEHIKAVQYLCLLQQIDGGSVVYSLSFCHWVREGNIWAHDYFDQVL
jgi:hypothetical protein